MNEAPAPAKVHCRLRLLDRLARRWLTARRGAPGAAALLAGLLAAQAHAEGLARLRAFMDGTRSGQAEFSQQVTPRDGRPQPAVTGQIAFQRPGLFRWEAQQPYRQLIVADGKKVWLWDADLNQVTVKPQDKALGASPAALLAGDNGGLERDFRLIERGSSEGLEWAEAVPRAGEFGFDSIRLGFAGSELARMDLTDSFGQITRIRFTHFSHALDRGAGRFAFHPPAGADVISE
jgi:outer membrane lipoprotein carrier protein